MLPVSAELLRREPKLRIVYKDIPILGPGSVVGAKAVLAAQRQGAYLKMREALMTGPAQVDADLVKSFAQRLGLDWERLQRDMADPAIQARLDANLKLAHVLGIQGTPAYVIGDQLLPGAVGLDDLQQVIALARKS
jgi:protein-disulfide isomerase